MNSGDPLLILFALSCSAFAAILTWMIVGECTDDWWRKELVARGTAEYVIDSGGNRQWRWKEQVEKP